MEIGTPKPAIVIEPLHEPVPGGPDNPAPPEPTYEPVPEPVREPEKVPA